VATTVTVRLGGVGLPAVTTTVVALLVVVDCSEAVTMLVLVVLASSEAVTVLVLVLVALTAVVGLVALVMLPQYASPLPHQPELEQHRSCGQMTSPPQAPSVEYLLPLGGG